MPDLTAKIKPGGKKNKKKEKERTDLREGASASSAVSAWRKTSDSAVKKACLEIAAAHMRITATLK